jgi:hypothetical protein
VAAAPRHLELRGAAPGAGGAFDVLGVPAGDSSRARAGPLSGMLAPMARSVLAGVWVAVLAALLAGSAGAAASGRGARAEEPASPVAPAEPGGGSPPAPADVASLDPIEECASVAPRLEKVRQLPVTRAPQILLSRRGAHRAPAPLAPHPLSGCAEVARWCLAHATSTSTP